MHSLPGKSFHIKLKCVHFCRHDLDIHMYVCIYTHLERVIMKKPPWSKIAEVAAARRMSSALLLAAENTTCKLCHNTISHFRSWY